MVVLQTVPLLSLFPGDELLRLGPLKVERTSRRKAADDKEYLGKPPRDPPRNPNLSACARSLGSRAGPNPRDAHVGSPRECTSEFPPRVTEKGRRRAADSVSPKP